MGKALLIIVLGSGLILTKQLWSTTDNEQRTGKSQIEYQEEVIAREIAASAFNVAMGEIRSHGEDVHSGVDDFNGATDGRTGSYTSGRFAGGAYSTTSMLTSGHSVRVVSTGTYGDAEFTMHDEYRVPVLIAREDGIVEVEIEVSDPDVCSAIFYQAYPIGVAPANLPPPEMIYASSDENRAAGAKAREPLQSIYVTAGTQMNFYLAIDEDCSLEVDVEADECYARTVAANYTFDPGDWDSVHFALEIDPDDVDQAEEGPWAFVEQNASDRQDWRISWEDTHDWNAPADDDPDNSLQALKSFGYGGNGWTLAGGTAYVNIADQGASRPDFDDQSITVSVFDIHNPNFKGKMTSTMAKQKHCGEELDEPLDGDEYDVDGDGETDVEEEPEPDPAPDESEDAEYPDEDGFTEEELTDYACQCTSNGTKDNKTAILHRPPGNEANEHLICIGNPAVPSHFDNHNDVFPTCESGGRAKRNNNKKK